MLERLQQYLLWIGITIPVYAAMAYYIPSNPKWLAFNSSNARQKFTDLAFRTYTLTS
ncbi:hypothetical protein BR1R5_20550 [Pseudomonas sp. BR1R-5]|nr:hypothetical protein BR1R5_20550 [Pseudomonas sp. BR1R-5]